MEIMQGTQEWHAARLGKVTASRLCDVMAVLKSGGEAAARRDYKMQLLCERLTGIHADNFVTADMQRGTELEPLARGQYEARTRADLVQVGFVDHWSIEMFGASPDSLVGDSGLLETKCPKTSTHIRFLETGEIDQDYKWQMIAQIACTRRRWCDFVSFDDRLPDSLQYKCVRFIPSPAEILAAEQGVIKFLGELKILENKLKSGAIS